MKKSVLIILAAFLLAACGPAQEPSEPAAESSLASEETESSQVSQPESSPESSAEPEESAESAGFTPVEGRQITCDRLLPAHTEEEYDPQLLTLEDGQRYYTIQQNGKWGLIQEDGTELLPCRNEYPVSLCMSDHWNWDSSALSSEEQNQKSEELMEKTGFPLCFGHGAGLNTYFINLDTMGAPELVSQGEARFSSEPLNEGNTPSDPYFPVYFGRIENPEEIPDLSDDGYWNFTDVSGNQLAEGIEFEKVGWFDGEKLAPVCQDGKWAYLDTEGNLVTDFVYDACWGCDHLRPETNPYYAYSLTGGYAPVCKDGKWGVIDETGAEIIPCSYDGGAPYPGGVWLAEGGAWQLYLFE